MFGAKKNNTKIDESSLIILVNITNYIDLKISDIKYYALLITVISCISYVVNKILGTNFMFITENFPYTPVDIVYNL